VPDAQPAEVAWHIRRRVAPDHGKPGQRWDTWGGVVVAAGDYGRHQPGGAYRNGISNLQVAECQKPVGKAPLQCVACGGGIDPAMGYLRDGGARHFGCA
jgi:hypothetical protein